VVEIACELRPMQATLVPEKREELTTEGGLALAEARQLEATKHALSRLTTAGIRTSLFIDPDEAAIRASLDLGADAVELHTGEYANAGGDARRAQLERINRAAAVARKLSLAVHAGHGLTYENVHPVAAIPEIEELNIGHSIISRAVLTGMKAAVRDMAEIVRRARLRA
jgi:pyridoxine 5-phosphate synthase